MFNRGIDALLEALPSVSGLTLPEIRRLLTRAWLETADSRLGVEGETSALPDDLRRLATALEVHAILPLEIEMPTVRACGFVAAEALMIAHELAPLTERDTQYWIFGSVRRFEHVEASLLYLVAGYDANAALAVNDLDDSQSRQTDPEGPISEWALHKILGLLRLSTSVDSGVAPEPDQQASLRSAVRHEIWRRIGTHIGDHVDWMALRTRDDPDSGRALRELADQLENRSDDARSPASHADLHHLLLLLAAACESTGGRALRAVPPPPDDDSGQFLSYQRTRAGLRPLLWPAAEEYARKALPGPSAHAVVAVPTGSGKSSVAELAIGQALCRGWVLYLAPTNALVGQIRRQTADVFGPGLVREFIGGAEYTQLVGEALIEVDDRQVLVMTPEKCSLALRQNPDAFARLALCVLDEAHLLGERNGRGVIAELVLAEVMHRAPQAQMLLMSALISNSAELAGWLTQASGRPAVVVDEPWRPTRTLRAIAGVDQARGQADASEAFRRLSGRAVSRVNEKFTTSIDLLAGLQGAWQSESLDDYSLVRTDIQVPLSINRAKKTDFGGYCTPTTVAIVQRLGERGDKILAFLPRSKHDSFLAANMMPGFSSTQFPLGEGVQALLLLADLELGVESALRAVLTKRVAVHTGALLREEQRASEVAFDTEIAIAMFATGTMAQGLNLPATAVVIGGTGIGYDNEADEQQKKDRARAQLLNAIGRAGRAHVAARSMAIVVPNKVVVLDSARDAMRAVTRAEFLQEEDASSVISSALDGLIADAMNGNLHVETMTNAEQVAFTFLSFASDAEDAQGVIGKTWAVHRAQARSRAEAIAGSITTIGQDFLDQENAPSWVALAAHQSGISLPDTVRIFSGLRAHLAGNAAPITIPQWADLMLDLLKNLTPRELQRILPKKPYGTSRLADIYEPGRKQQDAGWLNYGRALNAWMAGEPLISVAKAIHKKPVKDNAGRGSQDPIPRTLNVVSEGFRFGLSLVAGSLVAIVAMGHEHDPDGFWTLPDESSRSLNLLPLAVRSGADTPETLAWIRAGVHTRVAAHMLSSIVPAPEGQSDDDLQRWAFGRFNDLADGAILGFTTTDQDKVIGAVQAARDVR